MLEAGEVLNDNTWHSVSYKREVRNVRVTLDGTVSIERELPASYRHENLLSQAITIDEIRLGQPIGKKSYNTLLYYCTYKMLTAYIEAYP